jgi:hypothetical protein
MENQPNQPTKPVHEIRIGAVKAAIWANEGPNGVWHAVTFARLVKLGEEWKSVPSFQRGDLLPLAKVADQAHTWILTQEGKQAKR